MKKNKIIIALSVAAAAVVGTACTDNYLNVQPTTVVGQEEVTKTVDNARMAIYGLCSAMQTQYSSTAWNQYNGESYINTWLDDASGPDVIVGLSISSFGTENLKMQTWGEKDYVSTLLPWDYCYNLISQANVILNGIDNAEGSESARNFVKAQALTFRAHAFTRLLQFYAPRWEDSDNGAAYCTVLRLEPGVGPVPLSTMAETLDLIYSDLDEAIELYTNSSEKRTEKWEPDLSVAYGVYARAAMIKNDWAKAETMAHNAREGYKIMDNDTYLAGFYEDNDDFMWEQATDETDIYYWSWGSHFAANGTYVKNWGEGAPAISEDLVRELDPNDIRLRCFITPDKIALMNAEGLNKPKVTEEYFYDSELVDMGNNNNLATGYYNALKKTEKSKRYGLYNLALNYIVYYCQNFYKGDQEMLNNNGFYPYYTITNSEGATIELLKDADGKRLKGEMVTTPYGAQLKFIGIPPYGCSAYPFMRASEMCLTEAEAAYHNGHDAVAKACLNEINGKRIPGYTVTTSGAELLNEIRLCRRIELWGEGHSWSDWKRWNLPLVRRKLVAGDVNSGNWVETMETNISNVPSLENSFWRMTVPSGESDYNKAVDRSLLPW